MPPKKKVESEGIAFPPEVCGVCARRVLTEQGDLCMANPPFPLVSEEGIFWMRGAPVDETDPACVHFKPRCHA